MIEEIGHHVWPTLQLTLLALLTAIVLAIPLGILMANIRGRRGEAFVQAGSVIGLTVPPFWLGIIMILVLSTVAPSLQMLGYVPFTTDPIGNIQRLILPAFALSLPVAGPAEIARLGAEETRLREAHKLGFDAATLPRRVARGGRALSAPEGLRLVENGHLVDLVAEFAAGARPRARKASPEAE